jgi:hypothetical protein
MVTKDMVNGPGARPLRAMTMIEAMKATLKDMLVMLMNKWQTRSRALALSMET